MKGPTWTNHFKTGQGSITGACRCIKNNETTLKGPTIQGANELKKVTFQSMDLHGPGLVDLQPSLIYYK